MLFNSGGMRARPWWRPAAPDFVGRAHTWFFASAKGARSAAHRATVHYRQVRTWLKRIPGEHDIHASGNGRHNPDMSDIPAPRPAAAPSSFEALLRNARLASGLVLMVFVVTHLANHALNLISLETAEAGRHVFLAVWRNPLGDGPALRFAARPFRAGAARALPPAHAGHAGARGGAGRARAADPAACRRACRRNAPASRIVRRPTTPTNMWCARCGSPRRRSASRQAVALVVIWAHGCLGLYFWLRYRRWYPRAAPWLLIVAVLLPVLALLGFAACRPDGRGDGTADRQTPSTRRCSTRRSPPRTASIRPSISASLRSSRRCWSRALARDRIERRNLIEVDYPGGQAVRVPKGYSVLDASRLGGIPHYSVCGGRGRCSTCRVKVIEGLDGQPEAGQIERRRCSASPPKTTCGLPASSSRSTTSA